MPMTIISFFQMQLDGRFDLADRDLCLIFDGQFETDHLQTFRNSQPHRFQQRLLADPQSQYLFHLSMRWQLAPCLLLCCAQDLRDQGPRMNPWLEVLDVNAHDAR
jgi:hypothetical protein